MRQLYRFTEFYAAKLQERYNMDEMVNIRQERTNLCTFDKSQTQIGKINLLFTQDTLD